MRLKLAKRLKPQNYGCNSDGSLYQLRSWISNLVAPGLLRVNRLQAPSQWVRQLCVAKEARGKAGVLRERALPQGRPPAAGRVIGGLLTRRPRSQGHGLSSATPCDLSVFVSALISFPASALLQE